LKTKPPLSIFAKEKSIEIFTYRYFTKFRFANILRKLNVCGQVFKKHSLFWRLSNRYRGICLNSFNFFCKAKFSIMTTIFVVLVRCFSLSVLWQDVMFQEMLTFLNFTHFQKRCPLIIIGTFLKFFVTFKHFATKRKMFARIA
jgi:hypothetical protein